MHQNRKTCKQYTDVIFYHYHKPGCIESSIVSTNRNNFGKVKIVFSILYYIN